MRIHFIAIGGAVMHNLAIALHNKGYSVSGSDDEIFEPSLSRLDKYKLLPPAWGWDVSRISKELDAIILGMHAREDNPELKKARELGLKIYSFPEYLYEQTKNKTRVVIGGSHGKTTVTSMIMHALRANGMKFDYMVGSVLKGFDTMVELDDKNSIAVFEGDEYLTSPLDPRPKFHLYKPHIGLLTGIAWDHMNVFPSFEFYLKQFEIFSGMISDSMVYFEEDKYLQALAESNKGRIKLCPYKEVPSCSADEHSIVVNENTAVTLNIFGSHNMQNLAGAMQVCKLLGLPEKDFLFSMSTFQGAGRRQELLAQSRKKMVYLDFAHAPSKVSATVQAFRQQYPDKKLVACLELHTFSSLNTEFLPQYKSSMDLADIALVFYDPEVVRHKKLPSFEPNQVTEAFGRKDLIVLRDSKEVRERLLAIHDEDCIFLIMTSGSFSGLDLKQLAEEIVDVI
ncbi:MAG: peptidoglycan synthetase [Bacteroidales bacterium]|nr:peptidoglycan synthetase [Bacteroidales bacterium]MCB8998561.1 peptidoglycan synthetase [Bacteroidales bacterium]MCB9012571.1 peptidoglycan synthetase [Bacteroidales bacterium]